MDEFSFIAKYLKPLAADFPGSLNLSDDAALFSPEAGQELVITKDALSQGIHFLGLEDASLIAGKALRVNLSDLAAMGAKPVCYFLALMLPRDTSEEWLEKFASGLKQTQEEFKFSLAGGDTTVTNGSLSISVTALGTVPAGKALKRSDAKTGDDIYVSGTLGDSALGLELLQKGGNDNFLINRYLTPKPRVELGIHLRGLATSCMDISDGLAQDLGHICAASNTGAVVYANLLPLPLGEGGVRALEAALRGGDDYELLFTAPPEKSSQIAQISKTLGLPLTHIGKITTGNSVHIRDESGNEMMLSKKGFKHF